MDTDHSYWVFQNIFVTATQPVILCPADTYNLLNLGYYYEHFCLYFQLQICREDIFCNRKLFCILKIELKSAVERSNEHFSPQASQVSNGVYQYFSNIKLRSLDDCNIPKNGLRMKSAGNS